ncbi:MAG: NAD(P)/FAD-dependent oxidoreductase [Thermoprotei archaeon]
MKNILILGAGTGGTIVANNLAYRLADDIRNNKIKITVIDKSDVHYYQPGFLFIALNLMTPKEITRPIKSILAPGINFIKDEVNKIDLNNKLVSTASGKQLNYDYLVISTGARLDLESVPGIKEIDHFYSLEAALKLRDKISKFKNGNIVVAIGGLPYKCPPAPLEMTFMLDSYFRKLGIRDKVNITYAYPLPRVFTIQNVAEIMNGLLESRGVKTSLMFNVESIDPEKKEIKSMEGETLKYDIAIVIPPHKGSEVIEKSGIGDDEGWIPTDKYTLNIKGHDDVYAIGDATNIPTSKAGSVADFEAATVATRIVDDLQGVEPNKVYDGKTICFLVTGIGEGTILIFDYNTMPNPPPPSFACYWTKLAYNKLYWSLTVKSILPGMGW